MSALVKILLILVGFGRFLVCLDALGCLFRQTTGEFGREGWSIGRLS